MAYHDPSPTTHKLGGLHECSYEGSVWGYV